MKLADTEGDCHGWWRVIKELPRSDERPAMKDAMENQTICEDFQRFFVDKIAKIVEKIKCITNSGSLPPAVDLTYSTPSSPWCFTNIRDEEVLKAIHNILPKRSPLDFIPTAILKSCSNVFMPLIAMFANLSFSEGRFPVVFNFGQGSHC